MSDIKIVILAAGKGKRMEALGFDLPKPLIPIHGRPMIRHLIDAVNESQVDGEPIIITARTTVICFARRLVLGLVAMWFRKTIGHWTRGHVRQGSFYGYRTRDGAIWRPSDRDGADDPSAGAGAHGSGRHAHPCDREVSDFNSWRQWFYNFGRIVRGTDGKIARIVEFKDATEQEKTITEVNPAYMIFRRDWLCDNVALLTNKNAQGEYYLTDLVQLAVEQGELIRSITVDNPIEAIGINTPEQLKAAEEALES